MHAKSCKADSFFLTCEHCGHSQDASEVIEALQTLLDAVNRHAVTVGDCNQAKRALDNLKSA